jgi:hypothetical protein
MRKIIWAIAAVFSIQVAFQLAMTAERSDAEYATMQTPLRDPLTGYVDAGLDNDDLEIPSMAAYEPAFRQRSSVRPVADTAAISSTPSASRGPERMVSAAPFKPVVITYDRSGALADTTPLPVGPSRRMRVQDKQESRPLIAKIVTKPLDFLKAVASKFN